MRRGPDLLSPIVLGVMLGLAWGWSSARAAPPRAAPTAFVHADDAVPGHPGVTYLDLVRRLVPDLAMNPADRQIVLVGQAKEGWGKRRSWGAKAK
ncbi:MAG: hypothetical protein P4L73_11355 [Caulobacteraceae bacterium]|nr:hypothetical protein [Caulobacteraceae bacterium]